MARKPAAYERIAEDLRSRIFDGSLQEGDQLPSEKELIEDYAVSRIVVRDAVGILVSEGLVRREHGRGSFVRALVPPQKRIVGDFYGQRPTSSPFAASAKASGQKPEWDYQTRETTATRAVAGRLGIEPGDAVMKTSYTFYGDDEPVMLSTSFEPLSLTAGTSIQHPEASPVTGVVPRMDSIGQRVTHVVEDVIARAPRPQERESLKIDVGTPVLAVERTYYVEDRPVETADIVVAANRYVLSYRIPLPRGTEAPEDQ